MSIDDFTKLLDALTKLVSAIAWPLLVGFMLVRFGPSLKEFFQSLGEFSVKGAGFEASAKRKQAEAAAALAAAAASRPRPDLSTPPADVKETLDLVQEAVTPRILRKAANARVLWVDDRPDSNSYERQSLQALGVNFTLAVSTEDALHKLKDTDFDVIISDMARNPDPQAGYTLLDQLRAAGNRTPFVIYAGANETEHKAEARRHGALGSTSRASELFEYVVQALRAAA